MIRRTDPMIPTPLPTISPLVLTDITFRGRRNVISSPSIWHFVFLGRSGLLPADDNLAALDIESLPQDVGIHATALQVEDGLRLLVARKLPYA